MTWLMFSKWWVNEKMTEGYNDYKGNKNTSLPFSILQPTEVNRYTQRNELRNNAQILRDKRRNIRPSQSLSKTCTEI